MHTPDHSRPLFATKPNDPSTPFIGYVRRINMEPIGSGRDRKLVCSAFVNDGSGAEVQIYTDDPRLEGALFAAYASVLPLQDKPSNVEVTFINAGNDLILTRIDLLERAVPQNTIYETTGEDDSLASDAQTFNQTDSQFDRDIEAEPNDPQSRYRNQMKAEAKAVGAPTRRIRRGTPEFTQLVLNYNPDIVFKTEDNRRMTHRLKEMVDNLAQLVRIEWPQNRDVPPTLLLVTQTWADAIQYTENSVHYETRAADMMLIQGPNVLESQLNDLASLAAQAGFDWVNVEEPNGHQGPRKHVHASVRRDPS